MQSDRTIFLLRYCLPAGVFVSTWTGSLDGDDPTAQNGPGEIVLELRKSTVSMSASKRGKKRTAQAAAIAPECRERDPMIAVFGPVQEHQQATGCCPVRGDSRERDRGKEHEREKRQCRRSDALLAHVVRGKRRVPGRYALEKQVGVYTAYYALTGVIELHRLLRT